MATRSVPRHRAQAELAGLVTAVCSAAVSSGTAANAQRAARHGHRKPVTCRNIASTPPAHRVLARWHSPAPAFGYRPEALPLPVVQRLDRKAHLRARPVQMTAPGRSANSRYPLRKSAWTWVSITRSIRKPRSAASSR